MKRGETITVAVDRLAVSGDGLAEDGERNIRVRGALPGDTALVRIRSVKRTSVLADVERIEAAGIPRIDPPCPHFGVCGGCRMQNIPYEAQCALKAGIVKDALTGITGIEPPGEVPLVPSPEIFYYRNKMEFSFDSPPGSGVLHLGLHERGRFDRVFDVTGCMLQSERSNAIVEAVRGFAVERGVSVYGLKSHEGILRYLVIREGKLTGETMVTLVTSGEDFPGESACADMLRARFPETTTFVLGVNRMTGSVAACRERRILSGEGFITERVGGCAFAVSPDSFFQTNTLQAHALLETIGEFSGLDGEGNLLDLYCGTGAIGVFLSPRAGRITGIELSEEAVADARLNAERNDAENCSFIAGGVETLLDEGLGRFDVAVCDPPRVGLHPKALAALLRMRIPRLVYVSCNAAAIPRDLEMLAMAGYRIRNLRALDMAPHTPHVETVIGLEIG